MELVKADQPALKIFQIFVEDLQGFYEMQLSLKEEQYRTELKAKNREIADHKRHSADMGEIAKLLATRPIIVEANPVTEKVQNIQNNYGPVGNAAVNNNDTMSAHS